MLYLFDRSNNTYSHQIPFDYLQSLYAFALKATTELPEVPDSLRATTAKCLH